MHNNSERFTHDLVLLGGGHSHALLLLRWAMNPLPGVRVTLVSENSESPYSGMLPGLVAGHYSRDDVHIDLRNLCRHAGARFIQANVLRIDPAQQTVALENRPALAYDTLSINVGATPDLTVEGARKYSIPVKPIAGFWPRWQQQQNVLLTEKVPRTIAVVGGGAGSVELVLAMAHALRGAAVQHRFQLVTRGERLLPDYPDGMRRWLMQRLNSNNIQLHLDADIVQVRHGELITRRHQTIPADNIFWCTQARAAQWLAECDLDVTDAGFVRVHPTLQLLRWPTIFAAGDCAWIDAAPTARAGVYAVRQTPVLHHNIRQFIQGGVLKPYRPQTRFLSLLATGEHDAVGARGRLSIAGKWVWRWKDRIDRRFMKMLQQLPIAPPPAQQDSVSLEPPSMRCGGCGGKVGASVLQQALATLDAAAESCAINAMSLSTPHTPQTRDDAAIIQLGDAAGDRVMVQSVDALKPLLDDPYLTGRITTLHALSDLYAMHAVPHSAQLQVQLPIMQEHLQVRDMQQLLQGVKTELENAGAQLLGGHTLEAETLQLGLTVNGFAQPAALLKKSGAQAGDVWVLTKPLGTGALFAAAMRGFAKAQWIDQALPFLLQSNQAAAHILFQYGARALTDITGFGLVGHLLEMLNATHLGATLQLHKIPLLEGATACMEAGYSSTLAPANLRVRHQVTLDQVDASDPRYAVLFDPQTQGGLLAAIPAEQADACVEILRQQHVQAAIIGQCVAGRNIVVQA